MSLQDLRKKIDSLDEDLVRLLNERTEAVLEIGHHKEETGGEVYVPSREKEVLARVEALNKGPLPQNAVRAVYREIMSASLALEKNVQIAYLGPPATFTHQAARKHFGSSVTYIACETITDVFAAVQKKKVDYGVAPIENSTDGAVTHSLDQFVNTSLSICAEVYLPITQNLLARIPMDRIKRVYSKAEVFGQCRHWLYENLPGVDFIPASSTARAAEMAAAEEDCAALASELAAEMYGLDILADDIQDMSGNTTRFLVIGQRHAEPTGEDKTSIYFGVKHTAGALYGALQAFKENAINLTKIESRPSRAKAWEYYFFVDFEGHVEDPDVKEALTALKEHCTVMRIMGSYPKANME
ncbi:MAG: prephenate dehydratase [Spartobacteria bacterium]|nr:prephenate dehydratase [Spartobacteria bacterium]